MTYLSGFGFHEQTPFVKTLPGTSQLKLTSIICDALKLHDQKMDGQTTVTETA